MNRLTKLFITGALIALILIMGYKVLTYSVFTDSIKMKYNRKDAVENYFKHEKQIQELIIYFTSILPDDKDVVFGIGHNSNKLDIGISLLNGVVEENKPNIGGSDLELGSAKMDSILTILKWTDETIKLLKDKLDKSNCISISSGDPLQIEFRYSGLGLYSYLIFDRPLSDSLITRYNNKLGDTVITKRVIVKYSTSL